MMPDLFSPRLARAIAKLVGCRVKDVFASKIEWRRYSADTAGETSVEARIRANDGEFLTIQFTRPGVWPLQKKGKP